MGASHKCLPLVATGALGIVVGCGGGDTPKPAPPPVFPVDEENVEDFEPSLESLRIGKIINNWGRDPDMDWDAAITLAHLSKLAYEEGEARDVPLQELGFETIRPLSLGSHSGFVAATDDVGVIAFRGTNPTEVLDWISNVDIRLLADVASGRKIHTGFQTAYAGFKDNIESVFEKEEPERVWITGHSLGGAMAACCAYDRQLRGKKVTGVVTFGQPRIGNEALAEYLDKELGDRYLRLMNSGDPVPILPPCFGIKLPAYWHSGRRGWFLWGQFYTTQGPQIAAEPAPGDGAPQDDPENVEVMEGADEFQSMTDEDFLELQRELKAMRGESPTPVAGAAPGAAAPSSPQAQAFLGEVARFIMDRIDEHNMDEYLRQINDYRRSRFGESN